MLIILFCEELRGGGICGGVASVQGNLFITFVLYCVYQIRLCCPNEIRLCFPNRIRLCCECAGELVIIFVSYCAYK